MPEYWDLWQRDPEKWNALSENIAHGVVAALDRTPGASQAVQLQLNRWDLPGVEVFVAADSGLNEADGASRIVHAYAEVYEDMPTVVFGAGGWFDEQGPMPQEPWTRWWCHTCQETEAQWQLHVAQADDLTASVAARFGAALALVTRWRFDFPDRRWSGDGIAAEDPVRYSSINPGHRVEWNAG